jgi:3-deoxy-D-manno-octulosonic-acid transferase
MRKLYTLLFTLALPLVLLRLYWRGIKAPAYRLRWRERLGYYHCPPVKDVIWLHAVSVGEAEAAFALLKLLQSRHPEAVFMVTTTTPTGSARVQKVLGGSVVHVYLPYDVPVIVERFLQQFQPKLAVIMEKELWPNLFAACHVRQIPLFVINARLSARSARSYLKIPTLVKPTLAALNLIAAQTEDDRRRFVEIGATEEQVTVFGNIKFDMKIDPQTIAAGLALKCGLFSGRFVWIIGSSHQDEELVFLRLYPSLKVHIPELLLLIAPRHPERFQVVKKLCDEQQLEVTLRSGQGVVGKSCAVYIADSIGELKMLYAAADVAFVAGSLAAVGGHNVLEPAAVGVPVLFGPQMFNFQDIAAGMLAAGAAVQCADEAAISAAVLRLYDDVEFRQGLVAKARVFVDENQGATERIAGLLEKYF